MTAAIFVRTPETHLLKRASSANRILVNFFVQRSDLRDLYDKVAAGERISEADALRLFESKDLNAIGAIADLARQKKVGNRASYIVNRYINYSNYCILSCQFCSFARKKRDKDGFEFTVPQMVEKAREALKLGITELHIVGGLHPSLPFSYYTDMLKELNALNNCSAAVPAASSGSVSLPDKRNVPGTGTVPELAGGDACATWARVALLRGEIDLGNMGVRSLRLSHMLEKV